LQWLTRSLKKALQPVDGLEGLENTAF